MKFTINSYIHRITNFIPELKSSPGFDVDDESYVGLASILPFVKTKLDLYEYFLSINFAIYNYTDDEELKNMIEMEIIDDVYNFNVGLLKELSFGKVKEYIDTNKDCY